MAQPLPPANGPSSLTTQLRMLRRFKPHARLASTVFALQLVETALELVHPILVAAVIGTLVGHAGDHGPLPDAFVNTIVLLVLVLVSKALITYLATVSAARLSQDLENGLRTDLFRHVTRLRFRFHDQNRSGKTIANALRDMEQAKHFFKEVWFGYLTVGLLLVATVIASFDTHWTYGVVVLVTFGVAIRFVGGIGSRVAHLDRAVCDDYDEVSTVLQENVAGARVVRAFGRETSENEKYGGRMDSFSDGWGGEARFWTARMPWIASLYSVGLPLVMLIGVVRVRNGLAGDGATDGVLAWFGATSVSLGVEQVARVLLFCRKVNHRIRPLTRWVITGQKAAASGARVFEILDRTDLVPPSDSPRALPATGGALEFDGVHFAHRADAPVLRGVSLRVPAGQSLGILGPTGSGKSSLMQLVPRFYEPDQGRVLLDGIDVRDLDVAELRAAVGLVFQEPFLFSGTVHDNVAYGRPSVDRAEVERCTRLAAAHDFVSELPKGYDTIVGERGVSLSGGQRQRLTIARALAMDPRVLIFDDATASVDALTEKHLFDGIRAAARGRTTLVISQRVTSVKWCDRIAVVDQGVVTAVGTHRELLATSELYREIHAHQQLTGVMP